MLILHGGYEMTITVTIDTLQLAVIIVIVMFWSWTCFDIGRQWEKKDDTGKE